MAWLVAKVAVKIWPGLWSHLMTAGEGFFQAPSRWVSGPLSSWSEASLVPHHMVLFTGWAHDSVTSNPPPQSKQPPFSPPPHHQDGSHHLFTA